MIIFYHFLSFFIMIKNDKKMKKCLSFFIIFIIFIILEVFFVFCFKIISAIPKCYQVPKHILAAAPHFFLQRASLAAAPHFFLQRFTLAAAPHFSCTKCPLRQHRICHVATPELIVCATIHCAWRSVVVLCLVFLVRL